MYLCGAVRLLGVAGHTPCVIEGKLLSGRVLAAVVGHGDIVAEHGGRRVAIGQVTQNVLHVQEDGRRDVFALRDHDTVRHRLQKQRE